MSGNLPVKKITVLLSANSVTLLLATIPGVLLLFCDQRQAWADDYFDPAALELRDPQQKLADLHYFANAGGQQRQYLAQRTRGRTAECDVCRG